MSDFVPKKVYLRAIIQQLNHTEFLLIVTATKLYRKQHAEIGLDASKIIILMFKMNNAVTHRKMFEDEELEVLLHEDSYQEQAEFAESLGVDHSFETFESIRNDSKVRTLCAVRVKAGRRRTASCHV